MGISGGESKGQKKNKGKAAEVAGFLTCSVNSRGGERLNEKEWQSQSDNDYEVEAGVREDITWN